MVRTTKGASPLSVVSLGMLLVFLALQYPSAASAQCRTDRDCPSNRFCIDTSCLFRLDGAPSTVLFSPPYRPARPTYTTPTYTRSYTRTPAVTTTTTRARDPGWAFEAGVTGIVSTVVAFSLGLASEITNVGGQLVPSLPLGGIAVLVFGASVPLVAAGGKSARERSGIPDNAFLRLVGWGTYGAALTLASILVVVGIKTNIPSGIITATTLLGTTSAVIMTADAFKARSDALALSTHRDSPRASLSGGSGLTLAPQMNAGRLSGLMLGWGGRF